MKLLISSSFFCGFSFVFGFGCVVLVFLWVLFVCFGTAVLSSTSQFALLRRLYIMPHLILLLLKEEMLAFPSAAHSWCFLCPL